MTDRTEALESERADYLLQTIRDLIKAGIDDCLPSADIIGNVSLAIRLAAQDQKPVAYFWRGRREEKWNLSKFLSSYAYENKPLYLSPQPAAGWDAAIEACIDAVASVMRMEPSTAQGPIFDALKALRHNAPPDSGATKSEPTTHHINGPFASPMPDHGGADAGVREALEPFAALVPSAFDHSYPDDAEIVLVCNGEPHAYLKNIDFRRAKAALSALSKPAPVELSSHDLAMIDQAWENHKAALPVATVINDNQPGRTAIIEITTDPPTLPVGTKLYAGPKMVELPAPVAASASAEARLREALDAISHAEGMLSKHIEEFHDFNYEPHQVPQELAQLRGIQHHLLGSLIDEKGNPLSAHPHASEEATKSDETGIRVEDNPRSHGESLQQGPDTSSNPSTVATLHGKGSDAANVANPVATSDRASHVAPASLDPHASDCDKQGER